MRDHCLCDDIMLQGRRFSCCRAASLLYVALATCQGMSFSTTRKWMASARSWAAQGEALPTSEQQEKRSGLLQSCCTLWAGAHAVRCVQVHKSARVVHAHVLHTRAPRHALGCIDFIVLISAKWPRDSGFAVYVTARCCLGVGAVLQCSLFQEPGHDLDPQLCCLQPDCNTRMCLENGAISCCSFGVSHMRMQQPLSQFRHGYSNKPTQGCKPNSCPQCCLC